MTDFNSKYVMKVWKISGQAHCLMSYYVEAETKEKAREKFLAGKRTDLMQGKMTSPLFVGEVSVMEVADPLWDIDFETAYKNKAMVEALPIEELQRGFENPPPKQPEENYFNRTARETDAKAETAAGAIISMITALVPLIATKEFINERHQALIAAMRALMTRETKER